MKRILPTWALFVLALSPAWTDNILLSPTGVTLTTGQFQAETALSAANSRGNYVWFAAGLQQFEFNYVRFENPAGKKENQFGVQWSFLPETILTPAVSFGVKDATSQSKEGIGAYVAITRHLPVGIRSPIIKDFALTLGFGLKGVNGAFFGAEVALPHDLFFQYEFDSRDVNVAIGWQPNPRIRVKGYALRDEAYFGAEFVPLAF